jgi:glycosyltransferase A (GT-A) superfamily protein (DUF2064 family)
MFNAVRWSSTDALRDTIAAMERCRMSYEIGPEWFDVDTPEDLHRMRATLNLPVLPECKADRHRRRD